MPFMFGPTCIISLPKHAHSPTIVLSAVESVKAARTSIPIRSAGLHTPSPTRFRTGAGESPRYAGMHGPSRATGHASGGGASTPQLLTVGGIALTRDWFIPM